MKSYALALRTAIVRLIPALLLFAGAASAAYACPTNTEVMRDGISAVATMACADDNRAALCADHCHVASAATESTPSPVDSGHPPTRPTSVPAFATPQAIAVVLDWRAPESDIPPKRIYLITARLRN